MKDLQRLFDQTQEYIVIVLIAICIIVGTLQVLFRFLLHAPLAWSEEFIRYAFVWITFLGASLAVRENAHASITLIVKVMPKVVQVTLNILSNLLCIAFSIIIIKEGIDVITMQLQTNQLSAALEIPVAYIFLSIPVGAAAMTVYYFKNIVNVLRKDTAK